MPDFEYEKQYKGIVVGTDEVGRGPLAGPVVACAVCFKELKIDESLASQLDDSKKLSAQKREKLNDLIYQSGALIGIGQVSSQEIDKINILQASFLAMRLAIKEIEEQVKKIDMVLVDGNVSPIGWPWKTRTIIAGDAKSLSISAASIVAKVYRDRLMCDLAKEYPSYGWQKNAGYGTAEHIRALQLYGITPYHRLSYAPVKKLMK